MEKRKLSGTRSGSRRAEQWDEKAAKKREREECRELGDGELTV